MPRIRLVVLVTLAALIAPWLAPCRMAEPAAQAAMPCCRASAPAGPAARACCTPEGQQPAPPAPSAGPLAQSMAPVALDGPTALLAIPQPLQPTSAWRLPLQPRLPSAVLLI